MWQRLTESARQAVFFAQEQAGKLGQNAVAPEHLLLGIVRVPDTPGTLRLGQSAGAQLLAHLGVSLDAARAAVEARAMRGAGRLGQDMQLTPATKRVIDLAYDEAKRLKNSHIGVEHLILGILREGDSLAAQALNDLGVTLDAARTQSLQMQDKNGAQEEALPPAGKMQDLASYMKATFAVSPNRPSEELLSLDEAVKFLGTSKPTLYRLLGQDEIKGLKVGRQWRFRRADLTAYMERGPVAVAAAPKEDLDMELSFFADQLSEPEPDQSGDPEAKTVRLAHKIIQLAIQSKASDIHLDPNADDFLLRLRVDGVLQETRRLPASTRESLTAYFKTMAELDVSEKKLPQDGRIPVRHEGKDYDFRAAVLPSMHGESLTLRILARQDVLLGLDRLGITPEDLAQIRALLRRPNGIIVATGPNGAGKTTLLYSCLQEVAGVGKKTMTAEDPVEFLLPYTTQTQVNRKSGLSFPGILRSFMRSDPDVILVSEMRDPETALLAVEVSLTGHLLLTALHAGDAPSALMRLMEMGIEPYLVGATVAGVIATRLVRRVCEGCKQAVDLSATPTLAYVTRLAAEGGYEVPDAAAFVRGAGCEHCRGRGYRGRMGLYEVLPMTEDLAEAVLRRAPAEELADIAMERGMRTLLADGVRKAAEGLTTLEEVMRVVTVAA